MELVSPAGNLEKLRYAYAYGADAAYIGLKRFSLRVKADNFYENEYETVRTLKARYPHKKLFCALNISFHNDDIDRFLQDIDYFKAYPFDAFIIQDMGMVRILQKHFPNAALHLSTQANCINREAVKMYRDSGFRRVVLGREASLAEIAEIKDAVPDMELEVFVHGAMCIAYSGRCLMSAYMNGRSANAGFCSHSCRWEYRLMHAGGAQEAAQSGLFTLEEKKRPGEYFPVFEGEDFTAVLSSKDLCMIDRLDDLKKAGADSLKIEGRMKSLYYTAVVTRAYRKAVDLAEGRITREKAQPFIDDLYKTSHRAFGTGFFYGKDDANETVSGESAGEYDMAGTIEGIVPDEQAERIFAAALNTGAAFERSLENLHPKAREARQNDFALHPEKVPQVLIERAHCRLYAFRPLNQIDSQTELEAVSPDCAHLHIAPADYCFVDPETGKLLRSVSHNTSCLLYTNAALAPDWILRQKCARSSENTDALYG